MKVWVIGALGLVLIIIFYTILIVGGFFEVKSRTDLVGEKITVSVDKNWYELTEDIKVTLTNNLSNSIFIDGCRPYVVEGRPTIDGKILSDWAIVWMQKCETERIAEKIRPFSSKEFSMPAFVFDGELRISIDYYTECEEEKAISYAKCKNTSMIKSEPFIIIS